MFSKKCPTFDLPRSVSIRFEGQRNKEDMLQFPSNFIKTSRYSLLNFFPMALFLQFKRYANIYFLFIAVIQSIPILSPLNPFSAVAPLIFVLGLSLLREGINKIYIYNIIIIIALEDISRNKSDSFVNAADTTLLCDHVQSVIIWAQIEVGDLLLIRENEPFPSDLVVLGTSFPSGSDL